jgi:hypothetical protein
MKRFVLLLVVIIFTAAGLAVFTNYQATSFGPGKTRYDSALRVSGLPVTSVGHKAHGVLAMGQVASGVMVIAQGGVGVVTIAQGGVGVLFGLGQGMVGLMAIAQLGIALLFFFGQIGCGAFCLGQLVAGYAGAGQAAGTKHGMEWLRELDAEVRAMLTFRAPRLPSPEVRRPASPPR